MAEPAAELAAEPSVEPSTDLVETAASAGPPSEPKGHQSQVDPTDLAFQGLGKRAQKRLLRERRYEEKKLERRRAEKERIKRKKAEFREKIDKGLIAPPPKKQRIEQNPTNLRIVIDCSFNDLMTRKEINSMAKQIIRCYSANKVSPRPVREICIASHGGRIKECFDTRHKDVVRWSGVTWNANPYEETFDKEELVYLTADSNDRILEIDEGKVYIIGGIVDKNRHKKLCYEKASKQGIRTAQLPIGEYIKMASRKVLTVNHVFEILLKYMEHKDWEKAFLEVIPQRKFKENQGVGRRKEDGKDGEENEDGEEEGEEEDEGDEEDEEDEEENRSERGRKE